MGIIYNKINKIMRSKINDSDTQEDINSKIIFWDIISNILIIPVLIIIFFSLFIVALMYIQSDSNTTSTTFIENDVETVKYVTTYYETTVENTPSTCTLTTVVTEGEIVSEETSNCIEKPHMSRLDIMLHSKLSVLLLFSSLSLLSIGFTIFTRFRIVYLSWKFDVI